VGSKSEVSLKEKRSLNAIEKAGPNYLRINLYTIMIFGFI